MNNDISPSIVDNRIKYNIIQVFRFIAAFMVLVLHSTYYISERLQIGFNLYHQGANGVRLFFAISGFVMIVSSENLVKNVKGWKIFAIKRIIRIVPIYWILTTFKLFVLIFASSVILHANLNIGYIIKSYFFIPASNVDGSLSPLLGVGWTLNFEMFFYLMFTIALAFKIKPLIFLSFIFIPLSIMSIFKTDEWNSLRFYANPIVLDFLYGMVAGELILKGKKLYKKWAIPIILLGLMYLFLPRLDMFSVIYNYDNITFGVASFCVVFGGASIENQYGILMPKWLIYLGGASYSLYLIHPIIGPIAPTVLNLLNLKFTSFSILISLVLAILFGTLFYKYCEKPITQFLSKLLRKYKFI